MCIEKGIKQWTVQHNKALFLTCNAIPKAGYTYPITHKTKPRRHPTRTEAWYVFVLLSINHQGSRLESDSDLRRFPNGTMNPHAIPIWPGEKRMKQERKKE